MKHNEETKAQLITKVLLIEDNPGDARLVREMLAEARGAQFDLDCAERLSTGLKRLTKGNIDVVLLDLLLPDCQGLDTFLRVHAHTPGVPIVLLTILEDETLAVKAVRQGAQDYLVKGQVDSNLLARTIGYAIERKQAEKTLRESEGFSSSLLSNSPNPIIVINQDTSVRYVNPSLEKITGFSSSELIGKKAPYPWWTEETLQKTSGNLKQAMRGGTQKLEELFKRKSGERFWVEITSTPVESNGEFKYYLASWVDITKRKREEEELIRLSNAVKMSTDSIVISDLDAKIIDVNEATLKMYGTKDKSDLLGKKSFDIIAPENHEKALAGTKEVMEKGYIKGREYHIIIKDGSKVPVEMNTAIMKDAKGRPIGFVGVTRDITERKQAEEALRESEERYRSLTSDVLGTSAVGIFILDSDFRIAWVNKALERYFGLRSDKVIGKDKRQLIRERIQYIFEDSEGFTEKVLATYDDNTYIENFECYVLPDGERKERWLEHRSQPIRSGLYAGGRIEHYYDITKRKRAEEELKSSREQLRDLSVYLLTVREEERTRIARQIHDELGQILTASKMDLSWLGKRLPKEQKSLLEKTKSMSKLIDIAIYTAQSISAELRPRILDDLGLAATIEWLAEEFQKRTGIECEVALDPEDIILDQERSTTVFRILQLTLTNVARHAKATKVKVSLKEKAGKLLLEVRDNGKGITKKQISDPKSFGLMGIRERVHFWEGEVNIRGVQDKGTTVTVSIPLDKKGGVR